MRECSTCGKRYAWEVSECPRCWAAKRELGEHWEEVSEWVESVADTAAERAIMRHLNEEEHQ